MSEPRRANQCHSARRRVVVVGGGLAGIAAALRCADAGCSVTLFEARRWLGGLTHSFRRGELWVDNGQHVFLRCCTAYRALLCRLGMADQVTLQPRLEIPVRAAGDARTAWLRADRLPAPAHLARSVLRYHPVPLRDRLRFAAAAGALRRVDPAAEGSDEIGFGAWLRRHGQRDPAIHRLWDLVAVATLNARCDDASLALAAMVFQTGLLTDSSAADLGWSRVPLVTLHGAAASAALRGAGVTVRTGATVRGLRADAAGWRVRTDDGDTAAPDVVLAVPPAAAERLLPAGAVDLPAGWAGRLGSSPIVNAHVVLDRPVLERPFVAGVGGEAQWVFDRTESAGLRTGQYLAMSLSAADDLVDRPTAALRARLLPALAAVLPRLHRAEVLDFFVTRERRATFRPSPGSGAWRPPARTALPGLYLAGAWTRTGWPATMEGAVRSADTAVAVLLGRDPPSRPGPPIPEPTTTGQPTTEEAVA